MEQMNGYFLGLIGAIIGTIGTICGDSIKSWWDNKQRDFQIDDAINDSIEAVEKEAKSKPELRGKAKYELCVEFTNALMEYRGISVKPVLLEVKIHNKLAKIDKMKVNE